MDYDHDKVDEITLALLYLVSTEIGEGQGARAWKGWDAATITRLQEKGWISDPSRKSMTYTISPEGFEKSKQLFFKHFNERSTDSYS
jgi:hypothetical protein